MKLLNFAFAILIGCSARPYLDPSLVHLQVDVAPRRAAVGDKVLLSYKLKNAGSVTLKTCFTFKEGYTLWGSGSVNQRINSVDHARCVEAVNLAQQSLEWSSTIEVADVGTGAARLAGWVQLAVPGTCDEFGCDQETIRSREEVIVIASKKQP